MGRRNVTNFLLVSRGPHSRRTKRCFFHQLWPSTCPKADPAPSVSRILQGADSQIPLQCLQLHSQTLSYFSFKQRIANVCIHFLIWAAPPTSPTCGFHMAFMNARRLFQLVLMLQCFNCHNTVVSTDKSTRYGEKIMGKNPVLFTRPNSSTREESALGVAGRRVMWSMDQENKPVQ